MRLRGRHFLAPSLLTALELVGKRHRGRDARLDTFLDAVLARRRDAFCNQTYLALELLHLLRDDPGHGPGPDRLVAVLMADVVRHESAGGTDLDERTRAARIKHATRLADSVDPDRRRGSEPDEWLPLTALPVSLEHDEYFFLRALQAHEQVFTRLTAELDAATAAVRRGHVAGAAVAVHRANHVFDRAAQLFRLVATLRSEAVPRVPRVHRRRQRDPVRGLQALRAGLRGPDPGPAAVRGLRGRSGRRRRGAGPGQPHRGRPRPGGRAVDPVARSGR